MQFQPPLEKMPTRSRKTASWIVGILAVAAIILAIWAGVGGPVGHAPGAEVTAPRANGKKSTIRKAEDDPEGFTYYIITIEGADYILMRYTVEGRTQYALSPKAGGNNVPMPKLPTPKLITPTDDGKRK